MQVSVIGKQAQTTNKNVKQLIYAYQELRKQMEREDATMTYFELLKDNCLLIHMQKDSAVSQSYSKGSMFVTSYCNSLSRQMLVETAMDLLDAGYLVCYFDTDSILLTSLHPDVKPLAEVVDLNERRIGAWKLEHPNVSAFSILQKKTYSLRIDSDEPGGETQIITKNKGFRHISQEIIQRGDVNLFEQELALVLAGHKTRGLYFFQDNFVIKPGSFTIDVRPEAEAYKKLSLIGPRKYFSSKNFIELKEISMKRSELRELKCGIYKVNEKETEIEQPTDRVVIAKLAPLLPVYPFGFIDDKYTCNYEYVKFH